MSLSDLPPPSLSPRDGLLRVVTIGGGHGQALLLSALVRLTCDLTALVSVADDGGCSGMLREELGMPPPGDLRRCLSSLATQRDLAERFEERLSGGRSVGNLVIAEMCQDLGGLQLAVDWARVLLGCPGRVVPIAEEPATLNVYDMDHGRIEGESHIEKASERPLVVNVDGPSMMNPVARDAIAAADVILLGPGSFFGSTLAALMTADVAEHVQAARARKVFIENLAREAGGAPPPRDQARILRDHLVIRGADADMRLDVLSHGDTPSLTKTPEGSAWTRRLCEGDARTHDPELLSVALADILGSPLGPAPRGAPAHPRATLIFEEALRRAKKRLESSPVA